ncbi:MAG TPA: Lpg1974 family pore-forming outer membrane protein [Gammaproteobacteria bacterium]|nr:Lpg1974 family pore-forming outer membrane protein [Gammaproteobacteria bacterium]
MNNWRMSMHLKWNNAFSRVLASSVAVLMATTSLYAIPRDPCECPPPPVCCIEPAPGPFAFNYPFDMDLQCPRDFYLHADALWMQAKQDGMDFAIEDSNGATAPGPITHGRVAGFSKNNKDWDWNPGMRLGVGFYLDHDAWNLDFNWTWLNITDYTHASVGTAGGVLIPLWLTGQGTPTGTAPATGVFGPRASANWHAKFNTIDMSLGKPYYVSRYFVVNPHFGFRAAWINQHFSVDYAGSSFGPFSSRTVHHADNDFWGVGSRAGVDTNFLFGKGFRLFGNVAASMLFGKFEIEQNLTYPTLLSQDGFDLDYHFYQNVPNFELIIGLGWGRYFGCKQYHVALDLAYEFHEWWDQLNLRRFFSGSPTYTNDVVSRGNLTMNGLSLKLQFDM